MSWKGGGLKVLVLWIYGFFGNLMYRRTGWIGICGVNRDIGLEPEETKWLRVSPCSSLMSQFTPLIPNQPMQRYILCAFDWFYAFKRLCQSTFQSVYGSILIWPRSGDRPKIALCDTLGGRCLKQKFLSAMVNQHHMVSRTLAPLYTVFQL